MPTLYMIASHPERMAYQRFPMWFRRHLDQMILVCQMIRFDRGTSPGDRLARDVTQH